MVQQKHIQKHDEQLITLANILQFLREEENVDLLIESVINYLSHNFNYRLIWLGLYDRVKHHLIGKKGFPEGENNAFFEQTFVLNPGDILEQIVIQQRPIGIPDLREEERAQEWKELANKYEIQGTLLFPLRCKKRCFGVVLLGTHLWGVSPYESEKAHLAMVLGEFSASLYKLEMERQFSQIKRPAQPLFSILEQIYQKPSLDLRLESAVIQTKNFIKSTYTNVYWYSPEERAFWHRVTIKDSETQINTKRANSSAHILVSDAPDFYQALSGGELVTIGSGRSLLKAKTTEKLLSKLKIRSLIAAPIIVDQNLLGFLTVEDQQARIWDKVEKDYLRAVAQIMTLSVGQKELEWRSQQAKEENYLVTQVEKIVRTETKTSVALRNITQLLKDQFHIDNLWILTELSTRATYDIFYTDEHWKEELFLQRISKDEWQKHSNSNSILTIESVQSDHDLALWHESLKKMEVGALIACAVPQKYLPAILILSHRQAHLWTNSEQEIIKAIAENIGLLLGEEFLKQKVTNTSYHYQRMKKGFIDFWEIAFGTDNFEQVWLRYLTLILESPVGILITWDSGQQTPENTDIKGKVAALVNSTSYFSLPNDLTIPISKDPFMQNILNGTRGCHLVSRKTIPVESRYWLLSEKDVKPKTLSDNDTTMQGEQEPQNLEHFLTMALNPFGKENGEGIIIFGDITRNNWSSDRIELIELLIRQFASLIQFRKQETTSANEVKKLQFLNWYKHLCLEVMHQSVTSSMEAFGLLESQFNGEMEGSSLLQMRQQKLLGQLDNTRNLLESVLSQEKFKMTQNFTDVSLTNMLQRLLIMLEGIYKQRRLWLRLQNQGKVNIVSDAIKLECVMFELLMNCYKRAPNGSNIEVRFLTLEEEDLRIPYPSKDSTYIELSIWESNVSRFRKTNNDKPAPPDYENLSATEIKPNNFGLLMCQRVVSTLEGNIKFYTLEDGSFLTLLLLPLSHNSQNSQELKSQENSN
jgi:GAF domain-containing protein